MPWTSIIRYGTLAVGVSLMSIILLLGYQNNGLRKDIIAEATRAAQYAAAVESQKASIGRLDILLQQCQDLNEVVERASQQAVEDLRKSSEAALKKARTETLKVKESLHDEECAGVTIPSDAERVLRTGAARANGN